MVLGIVGALTACVGNTGAFVQNNIKRLLGYSSIAQAGYIRLRRRRRFRSTCYGGHADDSAVSVDLHVHESWRVFAVASIVGKNLGGAGEQIDAFAGLGRRSPMLALCMTACLISLIGLPPLAGFNVKLNVMLLIGNGGGWWWALVAVIGVNTVLSMYFYLRIVKTMYFDQSDLPAPPRSVPGLFLSSVCAIALVVLFLAFGRVAHATITHGQLLPSNAPEVSSR